MIKSLFLITILCQSNFSYSFNDDIITNKILDSLNNIIKIEAQLINDSLNNLDNYNSDGLAKALTNQFIIDTFKIERMIDLRMDIDFSTSGMNNTIYLAEKQYDSLVTIYYENLLNILKDDDKDLLIKSQTDWLKYRESHLSFIYSFYFDENYTDGGTMYTNIAAGESIALTKQRLLDLYYLLFINKF